VRQCFVESVLWNAFFARFELVLGYASFRQGVICELVDRRSFEERCGLENGSSLYYVVYLEGA
jgi:hypothetical protein